VNYSAIFTNLSFAAPHLQQQADLQNAQAALVQLQFAPSKIPDRLAGFPDARRPPGAEAESLAAVKHQIGF
jgi:hypothetical protein